MVVAGDERGDACVVAVRGSTRLGTGVVGVGVLVSRREVVTCAHVVNAALGRPLDAGDEPAGAVVLGWPRVDAAEPASASVSAWRPVAEGDLAVLRLDADAPAGAAVAELADRLPARGTPLHLFGYPADRPRGQWASVLLAGTVEGGYLQLDARTPGAPEVRRGYSGSPVLDDDGAVVGIVALAPAARASDSLAIPVARVHEVWRPRRRPERTGPAAEVVVLHLPYLRFGGGPGDAGAADHPDVLAGVADDVWPDLVVVTGDLATAGRRSEYERVVPFLERVRERFELPPHQVVLVPGDHDVNRLAAQEYFLKAAADEEDPTPPYWPKWRHFMAAFDRFYGAGEYEPPLERPAFTADRPWTLFELPDLRVAVAGLNSTMAISHRPADDRPWLGDEQVAWFEAELARLAADGWLVVGAVHDDRALPTALRDRAHAWFHGTGATDPAARTAVLRRDAARAGIGAALLAGTTAAAAAFETRLDPFLAEVAEITRVRHETVELTFNPGGDPGTSYLVATMRDPLGPVERWPVGAAARGVDLAVLHRFLDVADAPLRSLDPQLRSHLVYAGPPPGDSVRAAARVRGVVLHSLVEYRGVIDLDRVRTEQQRLVGADLRYPAELFVAQRFRQEHPVRERGRDGRPVLEEDALSRIVEWLGEEGARFVTVLGDFGRGKTFLMRQLVRELPGRVGGLEPLLVELRTLEKGPDLYDVVGQHLRRLDVGDVTDRKVRHLVSRGRVALLLDGFDELVQKVTYPTAAAYLTTLLDAATGEAKIVVTSRTQHFSDDGQVRRALLTTTAGREASRIVSLEDFGPKQIREFLVRHYAGDTERAKRRVTRLAGIRDLLGLSRNPRMLAFIADLPDARLDEAARSGGGPRGTIGAAGLYREILDHWLDGEVKRQTYRFGARAMPEEPRLAACRALALSLWKAPASGGDVVSAAELDRVAGTLKTLQGLGFTDAEAGHTIGSGSLLTRSGEGFGFVHRSVMEWLVADTAAEQVRAGEMPEALAAREMSDLMTDFFCDLAGEAAAMAWANDALLLPKDRATEIRRANATRVLTSESRRLSAERVPAGPDYGSPPIGWPGSSGPHRVPGQAGVPGTRPTGDVPPSSGRSDRLDLEGQDLRDQDVAAISRRLRFANLRRTIWTGLQVRNLDLTGADLTGADLTRARFTNVDLSLADLTGVALDRAAFLGGRPSLAPDAARLATRVPGDAATAVVGAAAPATAALALPELGLLALVRGAHVDLVDVTTWEPVRVLSGHAGPVRAMAALAAPDGTPLLATGGTDSRIVLWEPITGTARREFPVRRDAPVTALAAVRVAQDVLLASGDASGAVQLWETTGRRVRSPLLGHEGHIRSIAAYDGMLATGANDGTVRLWNPETALEIERPLTHDDAVVAVAAVAGVGGPPVLASAGADGLLKTWVPGQPGNSLRPGHADRICALAPVTFQGTTMLASADESGLVQVWNLEARTPVLRQRLAPPSRLAWAASLPAPDGSLHLVAGLADDTVFTWEPGTEPRRPLPWRHRPVVAVAAADPELLAISAPDGTVRLWNAKLGTPAGITFEGHEGAVPALATVTVPGGVVLATGGHDGTVRLWDVATGAPRGAPLAGHTGRVVAVRAGEGYAAPTFETDGEDGTRLAWDAATGHGVDVGVATRERPGSATATVPIPGLGHAMFAAMTGTVVMLADPGTGDGVDILTGHSATVTSLAALPMTGYTLLASGAHDGTVRLHRIDADRQVTPAGTIVSSGRGGWAYLSADGTSYKSDGDVGDVLWWAVRLNRFGAGELDEFDPSIRRLPDGEAVLP